MTCKEKRERLKKIRCFVLDMDGTIYLGNRLFPFTPAFLQAVEKSGREFCYFTNNSSKNAATYLQKLASMGIPTTPEKIRAATKEKSSRRMARGDVSKKKKT